MVYLWRKQREPLKMGIKEFCDMKKYVCSVCGFVYDEEKGYPEEGITPGTKWEDVPADFVCPLCGVGKEQFEAE